jgi:hypothetical protein
MDDVKIRGVNAPSFWKEHDSLILASYFLLLLIIAFLTGYYIDEEIGGQIFMFDVLSVIGIVAYSYGKSTPKKKR